MAIVKVAKDEAAGKFEPGDYVLVRHTDVGTEFWCLAIEHNTTYYTLAILLNGAILNMTGNSIGNVSASKAYEIVDIRPSNKVKLTLSFDK
jgi:hypothetical protein